MVAGTYNAYLHTSSTALHSLSVDEMAPSIFQHVSDRFHTPVPAIVFFSLTTCALVLFDFSYLVEVESFLYAVHAFLLCTTFIYLAFTQPQLKVPTFIPFGRIGNPPPSPRAPVVFNSYPTVLGHGNQACWSAGCCRWWCCWPS